MPAVKPAWFSKEDLKSETTDIFGRKLDPISQARYLQTEDWGRCGSIPWPSTILRSLTYWNRRKYPPQSVISLKRLTIGDSGPTTLGWFCQGASSGKVWTNFFISSHQPNSAAIRLGGAGGLVYIRICAGSGKQEVAKVGSHAQAMHHRVKRLNCGFESHQIHTNP